MLSCLMGKMPTLKISSPGNLSAEFLRRHASKIITVSWLLANYLRPEVYSMSENRLLFKPLQWPPLRLQRRNETIVKTDMVVWVL
jgi:hypothetical protein